MDNNDNALASLNEATKLVDNLRVAIEKSVDKITRHQERDLMSKVYKLSGFIKDVEGMVNVLETRVEIYENLMNGKKSSISKLSKKKRCFPLPRQSTTVKEDTVYENVLILIGDLTKTIADPVVKIKKEQMGELLTTLITITITMANVGWMVGKLEGRVYHSEMTNNEQHREIKSSNNGNASYERVVNAEINTESDTTQDEGPSRKNRKTGTKYPQEKRELKLF